jgi:hypothetical protein
MVYTGARVSEMAKRGFWITTSPQSATLLWSQNTNTCGCLAALAPPHCRRCLEHRRIGQCHCFTGAQQSCVSHRPCRLLFDILAAMQRPFPELTYLDLFLYKSVTVVLGSFLGGSVPRLRHLNLLGVHFRVYRNYFCLPLTSPIFSFITSLIPGTSHPRRSSPPSPR